MAVVGTAGRGVIIYQLENQPQEFKRMESPLKYQVCFLSSLPSGQCKWDFEHCYNEHSNGCAVAWFHSP